MPSPTDFNLSPYYDDFSEDKKFHRVLFRPAFAVQARELTQSQTQLQNQVERVSDHLFEKGAMIIPGEIGYDLNYYSIILSAKSNSTLADYNGVELTGATTGLVARVVGVSAADGTDPDTLFVKYSKTGTDNVTTVFSDTEILNCLINNGLVYLDLKPENIFFKWEKHITTKKKGIIKKIESRRVEIVE